MGLALEQYADDPVGFVEDVLGEGGRPYGKQSEVLERVAANRRVSVVGCNGSGEGLGCGPGSAVVDRDALAVEGDRDGADAAAGGGGGVAGASAGVCAGWPKPEREDARVEVRGERRAVCAGVRDGPSVQPAGVSLAGVAGGGYGGSRGGAGPPRRSEAAEPEAAAVHRQPVVADGGVLRLASLEERAVLAGGDLGVRHAEPGCGPPRRCAGDADSGGCG